MPSLGKVPNHSRTYIFGEGGEPRPSGTAYLRLLCKFLSFPGANKFGLASYLLRKRLDLPKSTTFAPGFRCIAGNLYCGEFVGLCDTFFVDYAPVYIGDHVAFSFRNMVITSSHDFTNFNRIISKPIILKNNVWVGSNVTIIGGVTIGENSVIGSGSVVSRDIPPNVLAVGNPCETLRTICRKI